MKSFKGKENVKNDNTDVEGDNDDDDNDDDELFYHCPIEHGHASCNISGYLT